MLVRICEYVASRADQFRNAARETDQGAVHAREPAYAQCLVVACDEGDVRALLAEEAYVMLIDGSYTCAHLDAHEIANDGTAVVQLIRKQDEKLSSVISNYYDSTKEAVRFLYKKGCRHIGLLHGNVDVKPFEERLKGYHKITKELHLPEIISGTEKFSEPGFHDGVNGTKKLLEIDPELDAILVAADVQGLGAIRALKELGISCPDQIKIISLTGFSLGHMLETAMTSMEVPSPEMGRAALRLLIDQIESTDKKKPSLQHIVFNATMVERETT